MFPIDRGQRQLIIGDKKTGKTQILLDTIVNQKNKDVICFYVSIGKTKKEIKRLYTKLVEKGANAYTTIVAAFNDDTSPLIKLTPYAALSMAEEYMKEGKDVLVCIDDLKKHADACREIALIAEKNTGREAYPADIFYTHSRLLEKGCQHKNGGSITILPVVETKGGDITDYVSTNIISITDGQIVLSEKNFKKGQKPAINFGLSVSRLGGAVQKPNIKTVGAVVRRELLSYLETADVYQLVKVDSMSSDLQEKIFRGKKMLELLKQPKFSPRSEQKMLETFNFVMSGSMTMLQEETSQPPQEEKPKKNDKPKCIQKEKTYLNIKIGFSFNYTS
jgi:F-type H+-transporting ATPase subunit alpha